MTMTKTSRSAGWIIDTTGATYRQLDSWVRRGYFGTGGIIGQGSGSRRTWTAADAEVAWALARCSELGNTALGVTRVVPFFEIVADAVRGRRVDPAGEWLLVTAEGHAVRTVGWPARCPIDIDAARLIRLRPFTADDAA